MKPDSSAGQLPMTRRARRAPFHRIVGDQFMARDSNSIATRSCRCRWRARSRPRFLDRNQIRE